MSSLELRASSIRVRQALLQKMPAELIAECKKVNLQNAQEMATGAQRIAPVSDDDDPGQLRRSHRFEVQDGGKAVAMAGGAAAPHAVHVEQGTRKMAARAWWWPFYRTRKKRFQQRYSRALTKIVKLFSA